ncbi:hypothetical protein LTR86_005885 [Recurvomyces mirabilis]|nr:hypothetical protein LTR86_005885 [Recurvomyces mirabilis]
MATQVPAPYRIFFTTIDPILAISGTLTSLFAPSLILGPSAPKIPTPESTFLLQSSAGFYAAFVLLQVFLLRARPHDLTVWRALEASLLITDIFIVVASFGFYGSKHGTAVPFLWKVEEIGNFVITAGVGVIRALFLLGVGLPSGAKSRSK